MTPSINKASVSFPKYTGFILPNLYLLFSYLTKQVDNLPKLVHIFIKMYSTPILLDDNIFLVPRSFQISELVSFPSTR